MIRDDAHWLSLIDAINSAALEPGGWPAALSELAAATGSRSAQLCGEVATGAAEFNWLTEFDPAALAELPLAGADDPALNLRLGIGAELPVLQVFADGDFLSPVARRANSFFSDFSARYDIPYSCQTSVVKEGGSWIGLAVIRSARQGEIGAEQRAVFASIAPHVRAAVRTQIALEQQGALLLTGALEALSLAVFICDHRGTVRAMTPAAEAMVSRGGGLRLKRGRLNTADPAETRPLTAAIQAAATGLRRPGRPLAGTVLVRNSRGSPLVLEVAPLPRQEHSLLCEPRALVLVRGGHADPERGKALLQAAYRLSPAEADIALRLADGLSPEAIAAIRGASLGTVRSQLRSIYAKLGAHHLGELLARVNQLR